MRERFLAGEEVSEGVRPEVLLSWHRCRDDYRVDPTQERAPSSPEREPSQLLDEKVVVAELAGLAKSIEDDAAGIGGLVAITDGRGGILAAWGDGSTLRLGDAANLSARCTWSEQGAGTNGMGTALATDGPIFIRGSEHWCAGFQDWDCAGVAIRDPVTRLPLGALDISTPNEPLPEQVLSWLRRGQETIEAGLRARALRTFQDLATVYWEEARGAQGPLAAADTGGRLVLANADARAYLGIVRAERPWDLTTATPQLQSALRAAVDRAQRDTSWMGVTTVALPGRPDTLSIAFRPAVKDARVVGLLLEATDGEDDGEPLPGPDEAALAMAPEPGRLVGLLGDRMVLVAAEEVRYAEADGSNVWLDTDRGRLRFPSGGIGGLEHRLLGHGFLRVHRHYLVNRRRVKELVPGINGCIELVLDVPATPTIPVARRRTSEVRRALAHG